MGVLQPPLSLVRLLEAKVGGRSALDHPFAITKRLLRDLRFRSLLCEFERRIEITRYQRLENPGFAEVSTTFFTLPYHLGGCLRP